MRDSIRLSFIVSLMSTPAVAAKFTEPPQTIAQEPQTVSLFILVLVLFFWLMVAIVSGFSARNRASRRGFRDERIRELETRLCVAQVDAEKSHHEIERLEEELEEKAMGLVRRDYVITEQQSKIKKIQSDLRYSVIKTRELRAELAERAVEIVHAEAKIRQARTGLSVVRASTDISRSPSASLR